MSPRLELGDLLVPIDQESFWSENLLVIGLALSAPTSEIVMGYKVMLPGGEVDWLSTTQVERFHRISGRS